MSLDSLRAALSAMSPESWVAVYILTAATVTGVVYMGLDLKTTDSGIAASFYGWTWYTLPYEEVTSIELAPMENRFTVLGFAVYDSDRSLAPSGKLRKIFTNPFVRRVIIRCADGSAVLVTPDDRESFIREVNRRREGTVPVENRAALTAADEVIMKRIAQERADRAEEERR